MSLPAKHVSAPMSVAYYPVFEPSPGLLIGADFSGKAIARTIDLLDSLAERAGVERLSAFASLGGADDFGIFAELGIDPPDAAWFPAAEGLRTVHALIAAVADLEQPALLGELTTLAEHLAEAARRGVRWHLSMDH